MTFMLGLVLGASLFALSPVSASNPCDMDPLEILRGAPKMPDYVIPLPIPGSVPYHEPPPPPLAPMWPWEPR
jgi:hypothetical protein